MDQDRLSSARIAQHIVVSLPLNALSDKDKWIGLLAKLAVFTTPAIIAANVRLFFVVLVLTSNA